jgi:hypothetical protein
MARKIAGLDALVPKTRNYQERRDNKHLRNIFSQKFRYLPELHARMLLQASRRETKKIASGSASHQLRFLSVRLVVREFPATPAEIQPNDIFLMLPACRPELH